MKKLALLFLTILSSLSLNTLANNVTSNQVIVVDAGSSGTRLHLFQKNDNGTMTELTSKVKVTPGLSSFIDDTQADKNGVDTTGIQNSMSELVKQLNNPSMIAPGTPMYVDATAGLRLVRKDAANMALQTAALALQKDLHLTLTPNYSIISGAQEAFYDWVGLNLTQNNTTDSESGVLDLGGASAEIAFDAPSAKASQSTFDLKVFTPLYQGKRYHIVAQSLLGEGEDAAMASIDGTTPNARAACFLQGTWGAEATGTDSAVHYDFTACKNDTIQFFTANQLTHKLQLLHQLLSDNPQSNWQAISGFAYTAGFFNASSVSALEANASQFQDTTWAQALKQYGAPQYLQKYFFAAAYSDALLQLCLNTAQPEVQFSKGVDWTNGVAFDHFFAS